MNHLVPLLAMDVEDLIGIGIVILFIVVPAVLQLLGKARGPQKPAPGGRQPGRPAGQPGGPPAGGEVEDEIGDFLRRAAQRRGGRQPAPRGPQRGAGRPAVAEVVGRQPVEAEVVREVPLGEQVRGHVGEYLDTGEFSRRAVQLGDEVAQADEQIDQRLHQVFDHDVGRLAGTPGESAAAPLAEELEEPEDRVTELPVTAAAGLPALLSSGAGIRQAIVISEILQRPEHRWKLLERR